MPQYYKATVARSSTTIDQVAYGYIWEDEKAVCSICLFDTLSVLRIVDTLQEIKASQHMERGVMLFDINAERKVFIVSIPFFHFPIRPLERFWGFAILSSFGRASSNHRSDPSRQS